MKRGSPTGGHGFTANADCPASAIVASWNLEKFCGDLNIVYSIFENLYPASTWFKMSPGVAVETVGLVAHVSNAYF